MLGKVSIRTFSIIIIYSGGCKVFVIPSFNSGSPSFFQCPLLVIIIIVIIDIIIIIIIIIIIVIMKLKVGPCLKPCVGYLSLSPGQYYFKRFLPGSKKILIPHVPILHVMMFTQEKGGMETKVKSTASQTPQTPPAPFQCRRTENYPVKQKTQRSKDERAIRSNPSAGLNPWSKGVDRPVDGVGKCFCGFQEIPIQIHILAFKCACSTSVI